MKKFVVMFCVVFGLLGTTLVNAAETGKSAYQLYTEANDNLAAAGSMLVEMSMVMEMDIGLGIPITMEMEGLIAQITGDDADIALMMEASTSTMGMVIEMLTYYKDGIYYMDMMGEKTKMEMSFDEVIAQTNTQLVGFPEDAVIVQSVEENEDGTVIQFTVNGSELTDILSSQMGMFDGFMLDDLDLDMDFGDLTLIAFINEEGFFDELVMTFELEMSMMGETVGIVYTISMDYIQFGDVEIEFPDDLDEYKDAGIIMMP